MISPLGLRASLQALDQCSQVDEEPRTALSLQLKQAQYEAARAFEQYNEVDPRNRLVAIDLESRWNTKLEEVDKVNASLAELDADVQTATPEERNA